MIEKGLISQGLATVEQLYQNREQRARELQSQGRKIVGYFCCFAPLEFMTALDLVPFRLGGSVKEPITEADAYLETIMCPFVRSSLDLAMKGRYDFLDGLVMPHACDSIERVYDIWRHNKETEYGHLLNVLHMLQPSSYEFFREELEVFKRSLEELAGRRVSPEGLRQAIWLHNENRALLRELYDLRKQDPPLISGTEVTKLLVAGMSIPVVEYNEIIRVVIGEVKGRQPGSRAKKTRILVYGSEIDDIAFIELVEECGANVVMDDLCTGTKTFWHDVEMTGELMDGLANRYLEKIICPRTYRGGVGTRLQDLELRFGYLHEFIRDFKVDGVIFYVIRFCDTFELEVPDVKEYLAGKGVPSLYLEDDYSVATIGQLRTRIEAFLEMISS